MPQVYFCNATLEKNQQQNSTGGQIYSAGGGITLIGMSIADTTKNPDGTLS